jgi:DNA-binding MarR family transcriptional regulator
MPASTPSDNRDNEWIVLGLLTSVDQDGAQSQRKFAADLGIALGLVNVYLKRCINKGLVKINEVPTRRYAYYLTPQGFAEKSRLTAEYFSSSFSFFRQAKADCHLVFETLRERGSNRVVLSGISDLAEIAVICAIDSGITIVAIVDARASATRYSGISVTPSFDVVDGDFDAVMVTDLKAPREAAELAAAHAGADRVFAPALLGIRPRKTAEAAE